MQYLLSVAIYEAEYVKFNEHIGIVLLTLLSN